MADKALEAALSESRLCFEGFLVLTLYSRVSLFEGFWVHTPPGAVSSFRLQTNTAWFS